MRSAHFDADLEIVDGISEMMTKGQLWTSGNAQLFDFVNPSKHLVLSERKSNSHNRRIAINHLKKTLYSSYIKDLYEDLTDYLQNILQAAAKNGFNPNRLIGEHKVSFEANDILQARNWDAIAQMVAEKVFRKLENEKKTSELLKKINSKLDLGVDINLINAALPYLEIRHLLVHADGKADENFCSKYSTICNTPNKKINNNYSLVLSAKTAVLNLVQDYDNKIVEKSILHNDDLKP
jgi:hypothetical protein